MRTGGPEEGVHKGVNTGVDGVNRGVNRGVHMHLSCASALGLCGKPTSPPRRRTIAKMGIHIHTGACLPLAYDSSWRSTRGGSKSCSVGTSVEAVVGALFSAPLDGELCDLRLAPLGELAVEAPARRCVVRNGVHAQAKAGGGQQWGAGRKY